jgi:hypothetical protein
MNMDRTGRTTIWIPLFRMLAVFALALAASSGRGDPLEEGFRQPSPEVHPKTLWFWMNGHVSRDGITRDLEAMKRVGISAVLIFDGGTYLPAGPAGYLQPVWRELMTHAIAEGRRLGIKIGMHNGPGWSSSGGPWITPERSMQQLVWTETTVTGAQPLDVALPQPQVNEEFYRDALVLAFPAQPGEEEPYEASIETIMTHGSDSAHQQKERVESWLLSDGRLDSATPVAPERVLSIEFAAPVEVHAVTANVAPGRSFPRLRIEASANGESYVPVATVGSPGRHGIAAPGVARFEPVRGRFFRVTPSGPTELAELVLHRSPRIKDWVFKANFAYRVGRQLEPLPDGGAAGAIDPAQVLDLSDRLDAQGRLRWQAPPGAWTILRIGHTSTGQRNVSASAAGSGLESDKFSREATEFHFNHVVGRVLADAGPLADAFTSVSIDSYEAGMQNWTASFPGEFARRAGYDLRPYLPAVFGRVVRDLKTSERFLYDFRRVQAELMKEAYYGQMAELCRARGLTFYVEGYGQGVFDELDVSGLPDVPMGEFWTRTPWAPNRTVKIVTSAAHVYGKPVVAMEAFTGEERTSRWLDYPYSLKVLGDDMFAWGANDLIFHRYAHQPHPTAMPGMAMGPWGFHFERTNTWFDYSAAWIDYLARSQHLLRQGTYVADVLYFVGERPPNNPQFAIPILPDGFNYDLVNTDVLLERVSVRNGRLTLPEGAEYRLLMLPPTLKLVTPELMRKLRDLVRAGAIVVGPKPAGSPTLRGYPESEAEVRRMAEELWDRGETGAGRVFAHRSVAEVIRELALQPDFEYAAMQTDAALSWSHRRLADGDLYFVSNRQRLTSDVVASFRIAGRQPEIWNPQTGTRHDAAVYASRDGRTRVPLRLGPAESVFVLFRRPAGRDGVEWLEKDGRRISDAHATTRQRPDVTNTFTMSIWAKPDIDLRLMPREAATGRLDETGKFYAIAAAEGDVLHGPGHAIAGLAVGRNGAYVIERGRAKSPAVLVERRPIEGWTHFAVVYRDGTPRLYINGEFVREGLRTGDVVHSGVGSPPPLPDTVFHFAALENVTRASGAPPPPAQGRAFLFEGNLTRPELFDQPLTEEAIAELVRRGIPPPHTAPVAELAAFDKGRLSARFWESGHYALSTGVSARVEVASPRTLMGPWQVEFEPGRGAPPHVTLPELTSWHRHADPGVSYFSGTAIYRRTLELAASELRKGQRVVLDLGRVEVVADVRVNGRAFAPLWKEPYRVDITDAVNPGSNQLEIRVANLWGNRLIGDERLPAEHAYASGGEPGILEVPAWYLSGEPKPTGGRTTFVPWHSYDANEPLLESGLLGPVRVFFPVDHVFETR